MVKNQQRLRVTAALTWLSAYPGRQEAPLIPAQLSVGFSFFKLCAPEAYHSSRHSVRDLKQVMKLKFKEKNEESNFSLEF